ncbi:MAG: hypothetical protein HKO67_13605 [Flavobacteriaceae bacterium]|nr:hypothetical protein [Flavobacteriaceae bacterium]
MPCTTANGYMFFTLNKECQIGIRFSKDVRKKYLEEYKMTIFKSYNAVMHGYILLRDDMLKDMNNMVRPLNKSYDYVIILESK